MKFIIPDNVKKTVLSLAHSTKIGRRIFFEYLLKTEYPGWLDLIHKDIKLWDKYLSSAKKGGNILLAETIGGFYPGQSINSLLAVALTMRGCNINILLCDRCMPACNLVSTNNFEKNEFLSKDSMKRICDNCYFPALKLYSEMGFSIHKYSDYLGAEDHVFIDNQISAVNFEAIKDYKLNNVAIGEHALAGTLRFFAKATLDEEEKRDEVLTKFLKSALMTYLVSERLFSKNKFVSVVSSHGIYTPWGIIGEVARQKSLRLINWNFSYRKKTFIFSHNDTYHHTLMNEPTEKWRNIQWTSGLENKILDYLNCRWYGTEDWISFQYKPNTDLDAIAAELNIDLSKPIIGMLTNVMWDAQLHYPANAFPSMLDWVIETIRYFSKRPDLQLLIRIHPAEIRGSLVSRQPINEEINKYFKSIPSNIIIIPPESRISTYKVMSACNAVIIFGTKTGVELTSMGIPVIVAGEAWIRNKGLTYDVISKKEYEEILDSLPFPLRLDEKTIKLARMYAFHFFYRRMIPIELIKDDDKPIITKFNAKSLADISVGKSLGLDIICNGIINGDDFIYPAEDMI